METSIDFNAVKTRQQAAWSTGDYAVVGTTLQIVGESLCEALDLRSGAQVLDVCAGNGNATLAAARRWCDVTSTDYVASLLESGRKRAEAEGHTIKFQEADAEKLPFGDASFDVVLSTFGVMFTPNQDQAAKELLRVCRPGRSGSASPTGLRRVSSVSCSRPSANTYHRPLASNRQRCGERARDSKSSLARARRRSARPSANSCFVTARQCIGSRSFERTTALSTRPSVRSTPKSKRPLPATCSSSSSKAIDRTIVPSSCRANTSKS